MLNRTWARTFRFAILLAGLGIISCAAPYSGSKASTGSYAWTQPGCTTPSPDPLAGPVIWTSFPSAEPSTPVDWCNAVGPAYQFRAGSRSSEEVDSLVVATWNVHVGGGDVVSFVADLRSGALTGKAENAFVLLLQEAHRAGADVPFSESRLTSRIAASPPSGERLDIAELARRLDLHAFYVPSMPNGRTRPEGPVPEDRGNAVLSTLPLREFEAIELPFEAQRRVAAVATISGINGEGKPWSLRIASGHLDTRSRGARILKTLGAGRARQAHALAQSITGEAVAVGADLNTWNLGFLEGALDLLRDRFPDTRTVTEPTFMALDLIPRRLDHLLLRLPGTFTASVRRVDDQYGSDHYPILGLITLK
jgi:endonuclease/exonuclease/phosphatase family metal-dependent hydrolase